MKIATFNINNINKGLQNLLAWLGSSKPENRSRYLSDQVVRAKDALLQPESRKRFDRILGQGWTDPVRFFHPNDAMYTYWSYLRDWWRRDAGLRIDHLLLSKEASKRLVASGARRRKRQRSCAGLERVA